jgi:hypothetical protein
VKDAGDSIIPGKQENERSMRRLFCAVADFPKLLALRRLNVGDNDEEDGNPAFLSPIETV